MSSGRIDGGRSSFQGLAPGWLSHTVGMLTDAVEVIRTQNNLGTSKEHATGVAQPGLYKFDWLPEREQQAMLQLRERADTAARDAAGNALNLGVDRLRAWAVNVSFMKTSGQPTWEDVGPHWKKLGFQSCDPRTDFRTGILAVDNLVYLCENHSAEAEQMCAEASSESICYPFAVASINVTQMLAWYLLLIDGPNPLGTDSAVAALDDPMLLHAFARLCVSEDAYGELHSAAMIRLHLAWHQGKAADPEANLSFFGRALQETLSAVDMFFRTSPLESADDFKRIWNHKPAK